MSARRLSLACVFSLSFAAACAHAADWLYLTSPGDTLIGIGQQYLKNPNDWPKVQVANTVSDPRRLPANTRIRIPVELLRVTPAPATVTAVTGNVRFKTADGPFQPLAAGHLLHGGETVLTGPRSSVSYRFADQTTLTQQASSRLRFGRLAVYGKTGMVATELDLDDGRLEASAARQVAPAGGFSVRTPVAVAGLRGTGFRLNLAEGGKVLRNEVLEGAVAVSAQGREVRVAGGYGTVAELGKPPQAPRPLLPAPPAEGLPAKLTRPSLAFAWQPVAGARAYRVQLGKTPDFAEILLDDTVTEPRLQWDVPLADGHYALRLRAIDEAGLEGLNRDHRFELAVHPLPPTPVSPAAGERVYPPEVLFNWAAAVGAHGYAIQISPSPTFTAGVIERRLPAVLTLREPLGEGDWYWRAASLDAQGEPHAWGEARRLRVQALPAAPADPSVRVDAGRARFTWAATAGAAGYDLEVARQADMTGRVFAERVAQPMASAELPPGSYFWRVRGVEADGRTGAWSPPNPLRMPPARPGQLGASVLVDLIAVRWQGEAAAYRVELARDAGFSQPLLTQAASAPRTALRKPEPGRYWLRVVALGEDGAESPASEALAIEVPTYRPWWLMPFLLLPVL